jgi:hypothetical protein
MVQYKQKCEQCKKNYVTVSTWPRRRGPAICYECEKERMNGVVDDPVMKKMFDIPEDFYQRNSFLRNIKINYLRYHSLTEPQINAFKKTVEDLKSKALLKEGEKSSVVLEVKKESRDLEKSKSDVSEKNIKPKESVLKKRVVKKK